MDVDHPGEAKGQQGPGEAEDERSRLRSDLLSVLTQDMAVHSRPEVQCPN